MSTTSILIVEDDRIVARDIKQQLLAMGYTVAGMTSDGAVVSLLAKESNADLVLMDIRLSGKTDGIDAAMAIRKTCDIPVVFLTAYADDDTLRRANLTEPYGYLLKPFETSQLRTVVEMAIYKHATEKQLRQSERRYAATLASIGDAVIVVDPAGFVTYINPVALKLTGWSQGEAEGRCVTEVFRIVEEMTREKLVPATQMVLGSHDLTVHDVRSAILLSKTGEEWPIEEQSTPLMGEREGAAGVVLVFRELSRRRAMERALRDAQDELAKVSLLTRMGEVTASIAHEINQPLAAIVANASAGLNWLRKPQLSETTDCLERIKADGTRAGDIIASLRTWAKSAATSVAELDMQSLVLEVMSLTRSELNRHGVKMLVQFSHVNLVVLADRIQIQQVLMNLISNAVDAMLDQPLEERHVQISILCDQEQRKMQLTVDDTGLGVSAGTETEIFKPFFTTKTHGMGMGLSICRTIVEAHGGRLIATPRNPHGASFAFDLPLVAAGLARD